MNENKICPLLSIGEEGFVVCQGADCAWYMRPTVYEKDDFCAVKALAVLPDLAKKVGQL